MRDLGSMCKSCGILRKSGGKAAQCAGTRRERGSEREKRGLNAHAMSWKWESGAVKRGGKLRKLERMAGKCVEKGLYGEEVR